MNYLKSKKKILILGSTGMLGHQLFNFLKKKNIICRYYWKPINTCKPYLTSFKNLPNSKKLQNKMMWLPSSLDMSFKQQKKVCDMINLFYSRKK